MSKIENNMNNIKEKWSEDIFQSIKGSQRAKPRPGLFIKIQNRIEAENTTIVSPLQWKFAAAAAVLLLLMTTSTWVYLSQQNQSNHNNVAAVDIYSQSLINGYQIYE